MLDSVESLRDRTGDPFREVCRGVQLPYSSVMRWRERRREGLELVSRPGPRKKKPLDQSRLDDAIENDLRFGGRRIGGTRMVYDRFREQISRRDYYSLVRATALELEGKQETLKRRIEWLVPGLAWALDDTEKDWLERYRSFVTLTHDYGSRFAAGVQGDDTKPTGLMTAMMAEGVFRRMNMVPLFAKHDRGSNFMAKELQDLFAENMVIALISPAHYPPYNGAVERAHQDIIRHVDGWIGRGAAASLTFRLACEVSRHEVNHIRRTSLGGLTACQALEEARPFIQAFGRRQRKEAYVRIKELAIDIGAELGEHSDNADETAFRYAAETWMQLNNMIKVTQNGEVLPPFYQIWSH